MRRNDSNCTRVLVLKPTHPSLVGSIDGSSTWRAGNVNGGLPARWWYRSANPLAARWVVSSSEQSMISPPATRALPMSAPSVATAAKLPMSHSNTRPPACSGG